jgi:DNA repair protein RadC
MPLTNPKDINDVYKKYFINIEQEKFLVIFLNNKKQLIKHKILFIGTIDKSIVHPREIIKEACSLSSSYIVVMHNHPSLDVNPSSEDIAFTLKLKSLMQTVGIPLLDHIITDGVNYYSFYENNVDFK